MRYACGLRGWRRGPFCGADRDCIVSGAHYQKLCLLTTNSSWINGFLHLFLPQAPCYVVDPLGFNNLYYSTVPELFDNLMLRPEGPQAPGRRPRRGSDPRRPLPRDLSFSELDCRPNLGDTGSSTNGSKPIVGQLLADLIATVGRTPLVRGCVSPKDSPLPSP